MPGIPDTAQTTASALAPGTIAIGPRTLPIPVGASKEMQAIVSAGTASHRMSGMEAPKNPEAWQALLTAIDTETGKNAVILAEKLGVSIQQDTVAGVNVYWLRPAKIADVHKDHFFVHLHGGAFVLNSGLAATTEGIITAAALGVPAISVDYRMPPKHPAPAALDDVLAVWQEVLKKYPAEKTFMGGSSAGASLTLSGVLRMKDLGLPLPQALYIGTPAVHMGFQGDSRFINQGIDSVLKNWAGMPAVAVAMYTAGADFEDPYLSPINGDFSHFPPTYLVSGTRDLLLSDTVRAHRKLRDAGVVAELHVYEGLSHAEYIFFLQIPEHSSHLKELNSFVSRFLQ